VTFYLFWEKQVYHW